MTHFSVGEQVIIRYGLKKSQKAKILRCTQPDSYMVKVDDGSVRFFSSKGLEKADDGIQQVVPSGNGAAPTSIPFLQRSFMTPKQTVPEREKELQALLATPAGRAELEALDSRYGAASGKVRPAKASIITYILIHERQRGLIAS
jgi:hypothetical protein